MTDFAWELPAALHSLWAIPVLAIIALYGARMRARSLRRMGSVESERNRRTVRTGLLLAAFACAVLALARPSSKASSPVPAEGKDIVLLFDVSRSMLAEDVKPNRLEAARLLGRQIMRTLSRERIGVAVFAGSAHVVCPLTSDFHFARSAIDSLSPVFAERGGTDLAQALDATLDAVFDDLPRKSRLLILLSDGETHGGPANDAARRAQQRGIRIFAVGFGDPSAGALVPGRGAVSRLDRASLRHAATGGYVDASDAGAAETILHAILSEGNSMRFVSDRDERFHWPLICVLGFLAANLITPERRAPK